MSSSLLGAAAAIGMTVVATRGTSMPAGTMALVGMGSVAAGVILVVSDVVRAWGR